MVLGLNLKPTNKTKPLFFDLQTQYDKAEQTLINALNSNKIFIYPTDTLYGIGCNAFNSTLVDKIFTIKKRDKNKPVSIVVSSIFDLEKYAIIDKYQKDLITNLLPGPYTIICKASKLAKQKFGDKIIKDDKIAIRIPEHMFIRWAVKKTRVPIVSTSANFSGDSTLPVSFKSINPALKLAVDFSIDAGTTLKAKPSTIIDVEKMEVIRKGAMHPSMEEIQEEELNASKSKK